MRDLHHIQMLILRELLFNPSARFSDLNIEDLTNDHFTYHINKLIQIGLVEKSDIGYSLSLKGKEFANRINTEDARMTKQAKISIVYCPVRTVNGRREYLIHKRKKEPFYGFMGFGTGKVQYGESFEEAAKRELKEETGLVAEPKFIGARHYTNVNSEEEVLADRILFAYLFENSSGELIRQMEEAENKWLREEEIMNLENKFPGFDEFFEELKKEETFFEERTFILDKI